MRIICLFCLLSPLMFLFSCVGKSQFPEKKSEKFPSNAVMLTQPLPMLAPQSSDSLPKLVVTHELILLNGFIAAYENRKNNFSVEKMELLWERVRKIIDNNANTLTFNWIEATGFLLELTGKPLYAETLQKLAENKNLSIPTSNSHLTVESLKPFIFTKNGDNIFVNIFINSSVEYTHSLNDSISVTLENIDAKNVVLRFKLKEKRDFEVKILIPSWTKYATVIQNNVKYAAIQGSYCTIAREWEDGDFIEIKLSNIRFSDSNIKSKTTIKLQNQ